LGCIHIVTTSAQLRHNFVSVKVQLRKRGPKASGSNRAFFLKHHQNIRRYNVLRINGHLGNAVKLLAARDAVFWRG
jgi:hypothetical protein